MAAVATTGITGRPQSRTYQAGAANMLRGLALVQGASDAQVLNASAANAPAFAIQAESTFGVGDAVSAVYDGEAVAIAGAPIVAPAYLITNAAGQLVPSAAAGDNVVARAVSSASQAGDELVVFVNPFIR